MNTIHTDIYEAIIAGIAERIIKQHRYSPDTDYIRHILGSTVKGRTGWFNQLHVDEDAYNAAIVYLLSDECKIDHGI
jgi:hypothetical protein